MEKIRAAFVGMGCRGLDLTDLVLRTMPDVEVAGVCDLYPDRTEQGRKLVAERSGREPLAVQDYRCLLDDKTIDCIVTPSAWEAHVPVVTDAMEAGKYAAMEVGGAYSLEECWKVVRTYEKTGVPCMMLENCCYDRNEMMIWRMVRAGLFGELVHCEGGYRHDLRDEISLGNENRHYRLRNYLNRNCENYPTHELGPLAKYLNINRGNRMISLVSMASCAKGLNHWIRDRKGNDFENANAAFAQGDVVTTLIKCAHGETITLHLDTCLPRPYSRANVVQGTKGMWSEERQGVCLDGAHLYTPAGDYQAAWGHPLWKDHKVVDAHGGMDYHVLRAFFEAVRNHTQTPIDAYDTAAWMSITPLSEQSIATGSMPVAIPDFTGGRWTNREPFVRSKYCLEDFCPECFGEL